MGDNVDVARALALVHVHTARALFFIILIILKAKLIFLIYLISTPRRASFKINPFWLTILRFVSARCRLPF